MPEARIRSKALRNVAVRNVAMRSVLAGTLALFSYLPDVDVARAESSDPFVAALVDVLVDEVERDEQRPPDRQGVLRRLAASASPAIRARVAEAAGGLGGEELGASLSLLQLLSVDGVPSVRSAAARGLAHVIDHAPDLVRTAIESQWATATASEQRQVAALALGQSSPDWLTDLAIGELARDRDARVRRAALGAAQRQLDSHPGAYVQLAVTRLSDPDRQVRHAARKLLRHAEPAGWASTLKSTPTRQRESKRRLRRALRGDVGRELAERPAFIRGRAAPSMA